MTGTILVDRRWARAGQRMAEHEAADDSLVGTLGTGDAADSVRGAGVVSSLTPRDVPGSLQASTVGRAQMGRAASACPPHAVCGWASAERIQAGIVGITGPLPPLVLARTAGAAKPGPGRSRADPRRTELEVIYSMPGRA